MAGSCTLGGTLTYTLAAINVGPTTAENVTITDVARPDGVTLLSAVPLCAVVGQTLTCNLGSVAAGDVALETIVVTVVGPVPTGMLITTAAVKSDRSDLIPATTLAA